MVSLLTNMSPMWYTHLLKGQLFVAGSMLVYVLCCLLKPGKLNEDNCLACQGLFFIGSELENCTGKQVLSGLVGWCGS